MKAMHIVLSLECGGLEHLVVQLVKALNDKGITSEIVCLQTEGELALEARKKGITVHFLGKKEGLDFGLFFRLKKFLKEQKADIVHTHNFSPLIYGSVAAKMAGIPCLNTRHGRTNQKTLSLIWNMNSFVVPVSEDTKTHLLKRNRIAKDRLKVIYNGIDLDAYNNGFDANHGKKLKEKLGVDPDSFVIGHVGRLSPEKDQTTLVKAFRKLMNKKMNATLLVVGDGPLRPILEKLAQKYDIADNVKFLGYRDDVPQLTSIFDVFVLSSYREGLSLSIVEAMASGKPVVATKVGGNPEVVIEGKTGYLVPCGFPERIESALMRLYVNRPLMDKLGEEGKRRAQEFFSIDHMVEEYAKLYEQAKK